MPSDGVVLAHQRLSILDLSSLGHQPMSSPRGIWHVVFNGELYNFQKLRLQLDYPFKSNCDTEVLVVALDVWGLQRTLEELEGMFAFAAWNSDTNELYLARDRLGQKPLYYGFHQDRFVFCSELHALKGLDGKPELDRESIALMLRYKAIPAPRSIYRGIWKLPPSSYCRFDFRAGELESPVYYWAPFRTSPSIGDRSIDEALDELDRQLLAATSKRLISDVPLGAFLSGGIDSTLIVAMMQRASSAPVKTFTIGFRDEKFNEAKQAAALAAHLGTEHHELYLQAKDVLEQVPKLASLTDEPFGDSSILPTYLLSRLTRQHVTVALSGDGGDEAFGGYNRHVWLPRLEGVLNSIPSPLLSWAAWMLGLPVLRSLLYAAQERGVLKVRMLEDKLNKLQSLIKSRSLQANYRDLLSDWKNPEILVQGSVQGLVDEFSGVGNGHSTLRSICYADSLFYLPTDVLYKVDRASMAVSLEARSPFLDHRLVEFAMTLPDHHLASQREGKLLTKGLLGRYVPRELFERPKMGFAAPIADWLRGELQEWAQDLLGSRRLMSGDLLDPGLVKEVWAEHLSGRRDHSGKLWNVLMLLDWLENRS